MAGLRIGEVAVRAGVPTSTVRYYERVGLVRPAARSAGGYRLYAEQAVIDIRFIRRAQALGFTGPEIMEILRLSRSGVAPCSRVVALGREHLVALDDKLKQLASFRRVLQRLVHGWESDPRSASGDGLCRLIETSDASPAAEHSLVRRGKRR